MVSNNWIYKGEEVVSISDMPENTFGFIYLLESIDGTVKYIGKKQIQSTLTKPLGKKELELKKGPGRKSKTKKVVKESNWRDYYGSNIQIKKLVQDKGREFFQRTILHYCTNKTELTYREIQYIILNNALEDLSYYNDNILGKIYRSNIIQK